MHLERGIGAFHRDAVAVQFERLRAIDADVKVFLADTLDTFLQGSITGPVGHRTGLQLLERQGGQNADRDDATRQRLGGCIEHGLGLLDLAAQARERRTGSGNGREIVFQIEAVEFELHVRIERGFEHFAIDR